MGREFHINGGEKTLATIKAFSATEKFIFGILVIIAIITSLYLALSVNDYFLVPIPAYGGQFTEGIVGLPRSVNPVLAVTDIDRDLSSLVYSGLMKYEHGELVPDLAEKYSVSDDGLTYTFFLKDNLRFQDGVPLTADDVEFTIQKIQDSVIKSPRRADWANISVKKVSTTEIQFILKQPYAPFLSNTTLGILPKHIWANVASDQFIFSQYNIQPVGSGPYKLDSIAHDSGGIPQSYTFSPFSRYTGTEAYIANLTVQFFPNEKSAFDAYAAKSIGAISGISPSEAVEIAKRDSSARILHTPLPRIFGVFFNQNQAPVLADADVRKALDMTVDKDLLVKNVLSGYGVRSDSPLPFGILNSSSTPTKPDLNGAKALLAKDGWSLGTDGVLVKKDKKGVVLQTLAFSIATADAPDLKQAADIVKTEWQALGAQVTVKVFEYGDLYQNIIATRKYDALLFGEFIGKDLDLYAFWHSSQRNAPGLNVAEYVNSKADKLLEDARVAADEDTKIQKYAQFEALVKSDVPAVFLYSPDFLYVAPSDIKGMNIGEITSPSDRFSDINSWYITTDNVWKIFVHDAENK